MAKVRVRVKVLGYPESTIREAYAAMVEPPSDDELTVML